MTVYGLRHPDGRWLYNLATLAGHQTFGSEPIDKMLADGALMEKIHGHWWASNTEAKQFTAVMKATQKVVGYTIDDPDMISVRYPATLTVEEYNERFDRDSLWDHYTAIRENAEAETRTCDEPVTVLEGREPPAPDEPQWVASLPNELANRPEYLHLFPGKIPGFRAHLHALIDARSDVRHCFQDYNGITGLYVSIDVPFDQPKTRWQADISRRTNKPLKTGRTVPVRVKRTLDLPVPHSISGSNYTEALAEWERQEAFWLSVVDSATVKACSACDGTGHIRDGAERFSRDR